MVPHPDATVQRILEERARKLARPADDAVAVKTVALVELAIGGDRFGIDLQAVHEIQPLHVLTPVPGIPAFWAGVVNLRGRLFPVLDLRPYLGMPAAEPPTDGLLVVVTAAGLTAAIWTGDVPGVRHVPQDELRAAPLDVPGVPLHLVTGVTPDLLTVLDLEVLFADPRLVLQSAGSGGE